MGQKTTAASQSLEHFDGPEELDRKVTELAEMIKSANGVMAFTGAGISTAAGIPDNRSPASTKVQTGPGKWESESNISKARNEGKLLNEPVQLSKIGSIIQNATPTLSHMALFKLQQERILGDIITSNYDNLHLKSGVSGDRLHELHGNLYLEKCTICETTYQREFRVRPLNLDQPGNHLTGRKCDNIKCGGNLIDCILHDGEKTSDKMMGKAIFSTVGQKGNVCLIIGNSLRVDPCSTIPISVKMAGGKVVYIGLQNAPDNMQMWINYPIFGKADDVMKLLMQKLEMEIPVYKLRKWFLVNMVKNEKDQGGTLYINPSQENGKIHKYLKSMKINGVEIDHIYIKDKYAQANEIIEIECTFEGFNDENVLKIELPIKKFVDYGIYKSSLKILVESNEDLNTWESVSVIRNSDFDDSIACNLEFSQNESLNPKPIIPNTDIGDVLRDPSGKTIGQKLTLQKIRPAWRVNMGMNDSDEEIKDNVNEFKINSTPKKSSYVQQKQYHLTLPNIAENRKSSDSSSPNGLTRKIQPRGNSRGVARNRQIR